MSHVFQVGLILKDGVLFYKYECKISMAMGVPGTEPRSFENAAHAVNLNHLSSCKVSLVPVGVCLGFGPNLWHCSLKPSWWRYCAAWVCSCSVRHLLLQSSILILLKRKLRHKEAVWLVRWFWLAGKQSLELLCKKQRDGENFRIHVQMVQPEPHC